MAFPFFTIGHSTRPIPDFVDLLRVGRVELVIDIRTIPRSRTNPHYNEDVLGDALAAYQIAHARIAALGGLRSRVREVAPEVNGWWENRSFHNYADHALSREFRQGLQELVTLSVAGRRLAHLSCKLNRHSNRPPARRYGCKILGVPRLYRWPGNIEAESRMTPKQNRRYTLIAMALLGIGLVMALAIGLQRSGSW